MFEELAVLNEQRMERTTSKQKIDYIVIALGMKFPLTRQ